MFHFVPTASATAQFLALWTCETLCKHEFQQEFIIGEERENGEFMNRKSRA